MTSYNGKQTIKEQSGMTLMGSAIIVAVALLTLTFIGGVLLGQGMTTQQECTITSEDELAISMYPLCIEDRARLVDDKYRLLSELETCQ